MDCETNVGGLLGPCQREEEGAILGDWSLPDCVISERQSLTDSFDIKLQYFGLCFADMNAND